MRRWGIAVSVFYAAVVMGFLLPGVLFLNPEGEANFIANYLEALSLYPETISDSKSIWALYIWPLMLVGGNALLLFLSVDTSWQRLRPRRHLAFTIAVIAMFAALLSSSAIWSLIAGIFGDDGGVWLSLTNWVIACWAVLWALWAIVFYVYYKTRTMRLEKALSWLLKGSVLELLIAVSAHVVVRQRNECSAPFATSFGIVTGIAIMLMCFGPGVLALYKRRMARYPKADSG